MKIRTALVAVLAAVCLSLLAQPTMAQSNLFSQYYTAPGASTVTAEMYMAPHPVPPWVGASYYTYQPLQPHEMLYTHKRNYYNYNVGADQYYCNDCTGRGGGGAMTKTTVRWQAGCNHMGKLPFTGATFSGMKYRLQQHKYCLENGACSGQRGGKIRGALGSHLHRHGGACATCGGEVYADGGCAGGCAQLTDGALKR